MGNLNPKQVQIVDSFGEGQAVIAGAGCGKTTTLVAKCVALLKLRPQARFCAVSFTEKSVRDLKVALSEGLPGGLNSDHWVKTIHGLCSSIIQEFPLEAGLQGGERILLEAESSLLWEKSLHVLWTSTDNEEISQAIDRLLKVYSRKQLESLLYRLKSLRSFGVENFIRKNQSREEVKDLWLVFESVAHRYEHTKNRDGALDFNDLEVYAKRALESERVRRYYQARFDLLLVDEFQDTNPIQGEILSQFAKSDFSNLCIVGDPKQSIYRFRDADVSVFQELTKKLPKKHLLDTNYRSRPSIIDFVNQVCSKTFEAVELPYEALEAGREKSENDQGVTKLVIESENELAEFLHSERQKGVDLSDFVILSRSVRKDKTQKFLKALEDREIPFSLGSGGRFYADPRVQELVACLKAWISSKNTLSAAVFLRTPWVGTSDQDLLNWGSQHPEGLLQGFFLESEHPIAIGLKNLFLHPRRILEFRPGEVLQALLEVESLDEELILPLVSLLHRSEDLSRSGRRFEEIVQYFSNAIIEGTIEKEVPAPAASGMVRIMTIHGSKGLQFKKVILLDFDGEYKSMSDRADLIWDRHQGVHLFHRDEDGKRIADDEQNTFWSALEKKANVAESKRVFYVALTRAQEELILVWKKEVKVSKAAQAPDYNPHLVDHWRAWVDTLVTLPIRELNLSTVDTLPIEKTVRAPLLKLISFDPKPYRPRHSASEWMILDQCELRYQKKFGLIHEGEEAPRPEEDVDPEFTTSLSNESVMEKGKRIHRALELEDFESFKAEISDSKTGEKLAETLKANLGPRNLAYPEIGFEIPFNSKQALVGVMDRLEVDREKKHIRVIDYKFTAKPKEKAAILEQYGLQIQLYTWAARALIDFVPERVSASFFHLTDGTLEMIEVPESMLEMNLIQTKVNELLEKSAKSKVAPISGKYCNYCEFKATCPLFMTQVPVDVTP